MKLPNIKPENRFGFTLVEIMAVLVIAALIMITVISVHSNVSKTASSIISKIDKDAPPREILQRIAEDIDRFVAGGTDVKITIKNKLENTGYQSAQMIISDSIFDSQNKPKEYKKIIWQTGFDADSQGLVLYRQYSGQTPEDKLLDSPEKFRRVHFVPLCDGITFFKIEASQQGQLADAWNKPELPPAIKASISFAEPVESITGQMQVPPEQIYSRTINTDRTRTVDYIFVKEEFELPDDYNDFNDVNDINDFDDVNDMNDFSIG